MPDNDAVRIAAYYTSAEERASVLEHMTATAPEDVREYSGLFEGTVTSEQLKELVAQNVSVERLHAQSSPFHDFNLRLPELVPDRASELVAGKPADHSLRRALQAFEQRAGVAEHGIGRRRRTSRNRRYAAEEPAAEEPASMYVVQMSDPVSEPQRRALDGLSVQITPHRRDKVYRAFVAPGRVRALRELPFVDSVTEPSVGDCITSTFLHQLERANRTPAKVRRKKFDLTVRRPEDVTKILEVLAATPDAEVVEKSGSIVRFKAAITADFLPRLVALPEVVELTPVRPARLQLDHARSLIGVDSLQTASPQWTGEGEMVAVIDSGVDTSHPDLMSRLAFTKSVVQGSGVQDRFGHGTHVSGIISGTGDASAGVIRGVAPEAKLAVLKVTDGAQVEMPLDFATWLQPVVEAGARVVNLSLGLTPEASGSDYDRYCTSIDEYIFRHPEILVVVSAGNSGIAPMGDCQLMTVSSPGSAKNVLTVGASSSSRLVPQETWGERTPAVFRLPPASQLPVTGSPDVMAASSGRGPASRYLLIKPDLVAPGTYILSARASGINPRLPWGDCGTFGNKYVYCGGSSMAAPFVAGAAAIVRQYLRTELNVDTPSAALVKAVLIAAATRLRSGRTPGSPDDYGYPDYDQGFGRVDLMNVIPTAAMPTRKLEVVDVANGSREALEHRAALDSGRSAVRQYRATVGVNATLPLRAVLTWTDHPGSGITNRLGLQVMRPGGSGVVGNAEHMTRVNPAFNRADANGVSWDQYNCVEQIVINPVPAGEYRIRVLALETAQPPQGYALVVSGELSKFEAI